MAGSDLERFERRFFGAADSLLRIGDGEVGGKAHGLVRARDLLRASFADERFAGLDLVVPRMVVLTTELFDLFVRRNRLESLEGDDLPDDRLAHAFRQGDLPTEFLGDLRALVEETHQPLAVRSSSLLEDAQFRPFAGVYATKMIPNDQASADARFQRLGEAVKFVLASTWFRGARDYRLAAGLSGAREQMAVIVQEVVGRRHGERFYPTLSGVARSFNFYPVGRARPEDGVVDLALGLGKTIVDGGLCWTYSPARPKAPPPFASATDLLKKTQTRFWAVRMGPPPVYDPLSEDEYLVEAGLAEADYDGALRYTASTLDPRSGRLVPGTGRDGPRALDFAPLLQLGELPLNDAVRALVAAGEQALGAEVEIEFALDVVPGAAGDGPRGRLGFLQIRPMVVDAEKVEIDPAEYDAPGLLLASERVLGNGVDRTVRDVVYLRPDRFNAAESRRIAGELQPINRRLLDEGRGCLLIGFGRWGSSDPWLGVPVAWGQIAAARAIVEAELPGYRIEPSQGSHFFHNISSFRVSYFMVPHASPHGIDWTWLDARPAESETEFVRHVRLDAPLSIKVDGRSAAGGVWREDPARGTASG